ncbi:MBL fold metallo-hydrolase [Paenibacillus sp. JSM ZJ436]|uniref:MBL fold metallo-hydrolase n=1 Tax=Paenibacillus sp. JSM ZJ436 TaxID=3376190 RepID=UPI0037B2E7FB
MNFRNWVNVIECFLEDGSALNLYVLEGEKLVLIDSGMATTPKQYIFPYLYARNRTPEDLSALVITHAHVDHFGGNASIYAANPSVSLFIHREDWEWAEDRQKHLAELYDVYPDQWRLSDHARSELLRMCGSDVPITNVLEDGEIVSTGDVAWTCLHLPGHSPGHIVLHQADLRAAICGDVIQQRGTVPQGTMVFPLYNHVGKYLESLQKIHDLQLDTAATSHFGVLEDEEVGRALFVSRNFVTQHDEIIVEHLRKAKEPLTLNELVFQIHALYYPQYEREFQIHATTHAHCMHLREQKEVARVLHNNQLKWCIGD